MILVSESWLKPTLPSSLVKLDGYTLVRNDRVGKGGGGVAAYIRNELQPRVICQSASEYCGRPEFLFIEIQTSVQKCLICVIYKAPKIGYLCDLENALIDTLPCYEHVILMGDLNTDLIINSTSATQLKNMFHSCNMSVLPLQPTHHTSTSDTLLDLIVTSQPQRILKHGQLPVPGLSAHDLIFAEYSLQCPKKNL